MITNTAPAKMVLQNSYAGYKTIFFSHSMFTDTDVYDRSFWITNPSNVVVRRDYTDVSRFSILLDGLVVNTVYRVQGAFVDAIIDNELLAAKFSINLSDEVSVKTRVPPTITAATSIAQQVDVGVGAPIVVINTAGEADYCIIEIQKVGTTDWTIAYQGPLLNPIQFGGIPVGDYKLRITGHITMPDGVTVESSGTAAWAGTLTVAYNFTPPSAPTNLAFKVANVKDGQERYDLRVSWDWAKATGANVREFLLEYVNTAAFTATGWTKAQKINVGAAQQATLFSFPFNVEHKFRVSSIAWGPDEQSITQSTVATFIINDSTPIDNSFTTETGIEVNYAHILGKLKDASNVWQQTFLLDAKTGAVAIGLLDADGKAPISFDPINKIVNVDGRIITKIINAASFVLTNLTGEENPALYTQGKAYGDNNAGVFIGMDNTTAKPKVDIGNGTQYIRYDGDILRISSGVVIGTPNGDVPIENGIQGKITVFIYQLATALPTRPVAQDYPPAGWQITPPNRVTQAQNVYSCTGLLDPVTNKLVSGTNYSAPVQWSGTEGANGANGATGPGFYSQALNPYGGFDAARATAFFQTSFGRGPTIYDVITQFNSANPAAAATRQWNGSAWVAPALSVHGDMIVNGTITSSKIVANYAFFAQIGVDVIYNRAAALSGNPEASYTMKIDLAGSYIHIR